MCGGGGGGVSVFFRGSEMILKTVIWSNPIVGIFMWCFLVVCGAMSSFVEFHVWRMEHRGSNVNVALSLGARIEGVTAATIFWEYRGDINPQNLHEWGHSHHHSQKFHPSSAHRGTREGIKLDCSPYQAGKRQTTHSGHLLH